MKNTFLKNDAEGRKLKAVFTDTWLPRLRWEQALMSVSYCCVAGMLCGCSTTSETFDCKAGQGVGCKSISEVNQMVNQQASGKETEIGKLPQLPNQPISFPPPIIPTTSAGIENQLAYSTSIPLSNTFMVHRMPEKYLRVWIAPYQDEQGNLHEGSAIHTVLKPSCWQLTPTPEKASIDLVNNPNVYNLYASNPSVEESKVQNQSETAPSIIDLEEYD